MINSSLIALSDGSQLGDTDIKSGSCLSIFQRARNKERGSYFRDSFRKFDIGEEQIFIILFFLYLARHIKIDFSFFFFLPLFHILHVTLILCSPPPDHLSESSLFSICLHCLHSYGFPFTRFSYYLWAYLACTETFSPMSCLVPFSQFPY